MNRWHFKLRDVLVLYGAALTLGSAIVWILMSASLVDLRALNILVLLLVSANVFYHARRKNATTQGGSTMNGWHFKLRDVIGLYIAALVIGASIVRILLAPSSSSIGDLGTYLVVLAMLFVSANVFYHSRKNARMKNATAAG